MEPRPFKLYGSGTAPPATVPQVPVQGVYFLDTRVLTVTGRDDSASYIEFKSTGYAYPGLPLQGVGTNCTLTKPSGLPLCVEYEFDGNLFSSPFDNDTSELLLGTLNNDGTLSSFDQLPAELLRPFDASELVGTWESQYVDSGNFSLCLLGFCCATIIDQFFHFRADGQYLFQESSESFSSADLGNVSTFANGAGSDASTGSYSVNGNLISLMTAQGETFELPIHITRDGNLVVGVFQYFASE